MKPKTRQEQYLSAIAGETSEIPEYPITREERYLNKIVENGGGGGGGGDVTGVKGSAETTYRKGNVSISPANIGLGNVDNTSDQNKPISNAAQEALDGKVDKVTGKGLSTEDFTTEEKAIVDDVTANLNLKVDKVSGKGLSTNDYDNTAKGIVDGVTTALVDKVDKVQGKGLSTNDYTDADKAEVAKVADKADAEDVIDGASYDSTNHLILFKNGTTTLFSLDAAAFVKDGMVDTVTITGGNLVITFNTDAGKQAISIPLTDIFDPANYYDKTATDNLLADKADKVSGATNGNFAGLDANGNLTDSGKSASDFATPADIAGQQNLLKDTVGWTGKNLLRYPYYDTTKTTSGITFTVNADGSVTADGTATENTNFIFRDEYYEHIDLKKYKGFILNGCPNGGSASTYYMRVRVGDASDHSYVSNVMDTGNGAEVPDVDSSKSLSFEYTIRSGTTMNNVTVRPMLRRADIEDSTYEPYHESVETMYEEEIHGVNLNSMPYHDGMSKTHKGVTFTVSSDGSITANGTATGGYAFFACHYRTSPYGKVLPNGKYIMSGCTGGSSSTYFMGANSTKNGANYNIGRQFDEEIEITLDGDDYYTDKTNVGFYFQVQEGQTVSNVTVYPMLRKADIEDSTYRPYNEQAIQNQLNTQGVLGAKNILPNNANSGSNRGITYTVNSDKSVTANGTATGGNSSYTIYEGTLPTGKYLFSGGVSEDFRFGLRKTSESSWIGDSRNEAPVPITIEANVSYSVFVWVKDVVTASNVVFKPMLRLASDPDDTYQPYAMTNRELTDKLIPSVVSVYRDTTTTNSATIRLYRYGNLRILTGNFNPSVAGTSATNTHIADLPLATDRPTYNAISTCGRGEQDSSSTAKIGNINVGPDGTIKYQGQATGENMFFNISWLVGV